MLSIIYCIITVSIFYWSIHLSIHSSIHPSIYLYRIATSCKTARQIDRQTDRHALQYLQSCIHPFNSMPPHDIQCRCITYRYNTIHPATIRNIYRRRHASTSKHALIDTWVNGYVTWTCEVHRFTDRQRHYILHIWHSDNNTVKVVQQKIIAVLDLKTEISFRELRYWIVAEIYGDLAEYWSESLGDWAALLDGSQLPIQQTTLLWLINKFVRRKDGNFRLLNLQALANVYVLLAWLYVQCMFYAYTPAKVCVCVRTQQHNFWVKSRDVSWRISPNREVAQTLQDCPGQWIIYYSV